MSYGNLIVIPFIVAIFIFTFFVFHDGLLSMADTNNNNRNIIIQRYDNLRDTEIEITGGYITGNYSESQGRTKLNIYVNVSNTGKTKIRDFSKIDVICIYVINKTQPPPERIGLYVGKKWVPYYATSTGEDYWKIEEFYSDYVNPGIWDPRESIKMRIYLEDAIDTKPLDVFKFAWVHITTPNGVSTSAYIIGNVDLA